MALVTPWGRIETTTVVVGGQTDHVQGMRLYGPDNNVIPADVTNGLAVDLKITRGSASAVVSYVAANNTSEKTIKAANSVRRGLIIRNQTAADLMIKFGTGVTPMSCTDLLPPYTSWDCPTTYQGAIYGVFSATDAFGAHVTEW